MPLPNATRYLCYRGVHEEDGHSSQLMPRTESVWERSHYHKGLAKVYWSQKS